jgi:AcrR family transcriptional regulator
MTQRHRSDSPRKRPGGRSARVVASVHSAVLEVLAKRGYQALSIAEVATHARVHETSIYRRWGTKAQLVSEAVIRSAAEEVPAVDTGSFRGDVVTLLRRVVARLRTPIGNAVGLVVVSQEPELAALRSAYWTSRLRVMGTIVTRAQERGEMRRSFDPQLALEMFSGPILLRLTSGKQVSEHYLEELVTRVIAALQAKGFRGSREIA